MTEEAPTVDLPTIDQLRSLQVAHEPSLVAELVHEFLARAAERISRMRTALAAADAAALAFEAHGLAGSCGVLGVFRMSTRCRELEELARQGALSQAPAALEAVIHSFEEASPVLAEAARQG